MSGGSSSFSFPAASSSFLSGQPSRTRSHLSFPNILKSYHTYTQLAFQLKVAHSITRKIEESSRRRIRTSVLPDGSPPLIPLPSDPSGHWKAWMVGTAVAVLLSFFKSQWSPLLKLKDEFEVTVKAADKVAEVVEKVADEVEKVADAVAHNTPENSKIHAAAVLVEKVAKEVAKDAHIVDAALDKVEEVEQEVEKDVESLLLEPITGEQPTSITKEPDA